MLLEAATEIKTHSQQCFAPRGTTEFTSRVKPGARPPLQNAINNVIFVA